MPLLYSDARPTADGFTTTRPRNPLPVAILGAGISGLSTAWHLLRNGIPVVVFEASSRAGGAIESCRTGGWLHEAGPNSLFEGTPEVGAFITELGLASRRLSASKAAKKRYIVRSGALCAAPSSPADFLSSPLLSPWGKLRILGEPFCSRGTDDHDESVADFVVRRLGAEFLDYVVNPFVAGVYAGDPRRLSVRQAFPKLHGLEQEHGSLIRGALKRRNPTGAPRGGMVSFPHGLQEIPRALVDSLGSALRLSHHVVSVRRASENWEVQFQAGGFLGRRLFSAVVCTLPAPVLAKLPFDAVPQAHHLAELREIDTPPVVSVFTGYLRTNVAHPLDGFGLLVPEVEKRRLLGTLFSSTLFPGRAPEGYVAVTSFLGGTRQPELAGLDDNTLIAVVREELSALLGASGVPEFVSIKRCPQGIPQYNVGFQHFKNVCSAVEAGAPGLYIGGNCRDGVSLAACLESGRKLASAVQQARTIKSSSLA